MDAGGRLLSSGRQARSGPGEGDGEEESGRKDQEAEGGDGKKNITVSGACVCRSLRVELSGMRTTVINIYLEMNQVKWAEAAPSFMFQ